MNNAQFKADYKFHQDWVGYKAYSNEKLTDKDIKEYNDLVSYFNDEVSIYTDSDMKRIAKSYTYAKNYQIIQTNNKQFARFDYNY